MELLKQYEYALEVLSMAYDNLKEESHLVDLTLLRGQIDEIQKELSLLQYIETIPEKTDTTDTKEKGMATI